MTLRSFCVATYKRNGEITSQTKFVQVLFLACGSSYRVSNDYGPKLFKRETPLDPETRSMFPQPIKREDLRDFLQGHVTPATGRREDIGDRIREIARKARLGGAKQIDQSAFFEALTDWLNSIIHTPENPEQLLDHYLRRVNGGVPEDRVAYLPPTRPGDKVDVFHPPAQQDYQPAFWGEFEHRWNMRNTGQEPWRGRSLVCLNPKDTGIRPTDASIRVSDRSPSQTNLIEVTGIFSARGRESKATSEWEMHDESGMNCFPGSPTAFNVEATLTNLHFTSLGGQPMTDVMEPCVAMKDVQEHLGARREMISQWIGQRNMAAYKVGRQWKFKLSEIDEWVRSGSAAGDDQTNWHSEEDVDA